MLTGAQTDKKAPICKNKQLHAIQSKQLEGGISTMANIRENLKKNEFSSVYLFSSVFSLLELN